MKLRRVLIRNFKGVRHLEFSMESATKSIAPLTALLGDNGSGKTSVLQAIALTLSLATRSVFSISSFRWHGFLSERLSSLGPSLVELDIAFDQDEVDITSQLFEEWREYLPSERKQLMRPTPPSQNLEVTLRLEDGKLTSPQGMGAIYQFLGRFYIKKIAEYRPQVKDLFANVGDVFWFDQHRNLGRKLYDPKYEDSAEGQKSEGWQAGVDLLREFLVGWWGHHTTPKRNSKDYIAPLERLLQRIFPGIRFAGVAPRGSDLQSGYKDFYILLERNDRIYDIAEMSSGEQAVFSVVYDFVRLDIQKSIVLIDELELHLHPPEQQKLLAALPKIGPDCQFIITTHSEYLSSVIPNEHEVRLDGGMRCL